MCDRLLTAVSFLREPTQGTMERLLASPLSAGEILLGYLGGFLAFALAEALPLTYASRALREVVIRGGGLDRIGPELAALGAFAAGSLVLGVLSLRRAGTA